MKRISALCIVFLLPSTAFAARDIESRIIESVDAKCMQRSIEDRDNNLIVVSNTYNDALARAIKERKEDLIDAWGLSSEKQREEKLADGWRVYEKSVSKARQKRTQGVRSTWKQYDSRRAACGQRNVTNGDPGAMQNDLNW